MKKTALICRLLFLCAILAPPQTSLSQNVGIGISNPTKGRLEVYGAIGTTSAIFGGDGAGISLQRNYPAIGFNQYYSTEAHAMQPGTSLVQYLDLPSGSLVIDSYSAALQANGIAQGKTRRFTFRYVCIGCSKHQYTGWCKVNYHYTHW